MDDFRAGREVLTELAGAEGFEPPLAVLETAGLPLNLRPWVSQTLTQQLVKPPASPSLLDFAVNLVFAARWAKLLEFQPLGRRFLVFGL